MYSCLRSVEDTHNLLRDHAARGTLGLFARLLCHLSRAAYAHVFVVAWLEHGHALLLQTYDAGLCFLGSVFFLAALWQWFWHFESVDDARITTFLLGDFV